MDLQLLILLMSHPVFGKLRMKCPLNSEDLNKKRPWSYYGQGDHLMSIVTSAETLAHNKLPFNLPPYTQSHIEPYGNKGIQRFIYFFQVVNKKRKLLHNLTLGYNIHENFLSTLGTSDALLDMLSTGEANVPNYSCGRKDNLLTLFDAADRMISIQMSTLVGTYKIAQISDKITSEALSDKSKFPFFHQMLPKEGFQYPAIVQLLLHFRWTLIGLLAPETEEGENFLRTFPPFLVRNGICVIITQQFSMTRYPAPLRVSNSKWKDVNVFVHFIDYIIISSTFHSFQLTLNSLLGPIEQKVWITTTLGKYLIYHHGYLKYIHSIWSFDFLKKMSPKYGAFEPYSFIDRQFQKKFFHCSFSKHIFSVKARKRCSQKALMETQEEKGSIRIANSDSVYIIFMTLAHALKAAYSSRSWRRRKKIQDTLEAPRLQPWQFHPFLEKNEFYNLSHLKLHLDQNGEVTADMDIQCLVVSSNRRLMKRKLGSIERQKLIINQRALSVLKLLNRPLPHSKCVESCQPGFVKWKREGEPVCCYDCVPCPERTISTQEGRRRCTQKAPLEIQNKNKMTNDHTVYSVIKTLAHALNAVYISRFRRRRKKGKERIADLRLEPWQFHPFLEKNDFCNISQMKLYLDENGDIAADLDITLWVVVPKKYLIRRPLASFERQRLVIDQDTLPELKILNKALPQSKCVENCQPGFVKRAREGEPVCCYDCVLCPEGTISTQEVKSSLDES